MHFSITLTAFGLAALLPSQVAGFWRMPCPGRLVTQRADPIIFPGIVSPHVHQIAGGNGFGFTEDYADARKSTCSSCPLKADLSNYWTPILYYKSQNGSFTKVPQAGDGAGIAGGMTVYYQQRGGPNNDAIKAFPEGLRMVAGNPFKRNYTGDSDFAAKAVSFVCLGGGGETHNLPTEACPQGMRAQVYFPSCWDGKNLDSADHSSHMSYPASGSDDNGPCPASHPVHLVSIFYEVIFNTAGFDFWSGDYGTNQPFVFSMGDPTGYGFHGDFLNGWDVPTLQTAIDTCLSPTSGTLEECPILYNNMFTNEESQACQIPSSVNEDIYGPFDAMPGCNPVTAGPEPASPITTCAVPAIAKPKASYTDMTSKDWAYVGCVDDSGSSRLFTGYTNMYDSDQDGTTVESCTSTCKTKGFTYAGLEDGKQCFCGNNAPPTAKSIVGVIGSCSAPCSGDSSQICGGAGMLSTYKTCSGSSCTNVGFTAINPSIEGTGANTGSSGTGSSSSGSASSASGSYSASASSAASAAGSKTSTYTASNIASTALTAFSDTASQSSVAELSSASGYDDSKNHKASSTLVKVSSSATSPAQSSAAPVNGAGGISPSDDGSTCAAPVTKTVQKTVYVTATASPEAHKRRKHHHQHAKHVRHAKDSFYYS